MDLEYEGIHPRWTTGVQNQSHTPQGFITVASIQTAAHSGSDAAGNSSLTGDLRFGEGWTEGEQTWISSMRTYT